MNRAAIGPKVTLVVATVLAARAGMARAQPAAPGADQEVDADNDGPGYTPAEAAPAAAALNLHGYVDVGLARAQGNGTSFAPEDSRVPLDYGSDPFAPAVNARGDVASTDADGRFVNGFLPRSVGIAGRPSFLVNTLNLDARYQHPSAPVMIFSRVQYLPRFSASGDASRFLVEQAFGRVTPFDAIELALSLGKFDSVFGSEYQDTQANLRVGVTPSLAARYTTGQSTGVKMFYRLQLAPLWSALSLNVAATNSGNMVESLQGSDTSLTGAPVLSGRLGYELNLKTLQIKVGGSGLRGPRNDQRDRNALQTMWGVDLRLFVAGFALGGEYLQVEEDEGLAPKTTPLGLFPFASGFRARVGWVQLAYAWSLEGVTLRRITPYARYDRRRAAFDGFTPITVDRMTTGLRIDLWDALIVKAEWLINGERAGAPTVANNVYTSSVVYQW